MLKYKIIGDDKKEYGPVGADEMREWIQEGRANAQSRVQRDGETEWHQLAAFPELAAILNEVAPATTILPTLPTSPISSGPAAKNNGLAIAGFVCGLVGVVCCPIGVVSLVGMILSIVGLVRIKRNPAQAGQALAIAGIALSIFGLIISVVFWVCFAAGFTQSLNNFNT
jgi:hypothetical protein